VLAENILMAKRVAKEAKTVEPAPARLAASAWQENPVTIATLALIA
jgi:hypothetical protein